MSQEEREEIETAYKNHLEKKLTVSEISLQDYLNTASICYRAAYKKEIGIEMTPLDMHKRRADMRHGGMLHIENPESKKEYMEWLNSETWDGAHPFEIVYSSDRHGIILYPPDGRYSCYRLDVFDPFYKMDFVRMAAALVEHEIPFEAYGLEKALDYVSGEGYVDVNSLMYADSFQYISSREYRKKYFPYIEWEKIEVVKWKM